MSDGPTVGGRRGFTLIELLTVLAILGVLAAILAPILVSARSRARQAVCISNLSQLDKAFLMYAGDSDSLLPPYQDDAGWGDHMTTALGHYRVSPARADLLVGTLRPYVQAEAVWFCPEDTFARSHTPRLAVDHFYTSYLTSPFLGVVGHPAMAEGTQIVPPQVSAGDLVLLSDDWQQALNGGCQAAYSHNGSFNYLHFDGHVSAARPDCAH